MVNMYLQNVENVGEYNSVAGDSSKVTFFWSPSLRSTSTIYLEESRFHHPKKVTNPELPSILVVLCNLQPLKLESRIMQNLWKVCESYLCNLA